MEIVIGGKMYEVFVNLLSLAILQVHRTSKIHFFKWSTHQSIKSHKDAGAVSRLSIKSNEHDDPDASDILTLSKICQ